MKIENWKTWQYENNAPFVLAKISLIQSSLIAFAIFINFFLFAYNHNYSIGSLISGTFLVFFTSFIIMVMCFLVIMALHIIKYKLIKNLLLKNKKTVLFFIAWFVLIINYFAIYFNIDNILKLTIDKFTALEITNIIVFYLLGTIVSFYIFNKDFYKIRKDENKEIIWDKHITKKEMFFE